MIEEEAKELEQANAALKEQVAQKGHGGILCIKEFKRLQRKGSPNSSNHFLKFGLTIQDLLMGFLTTHLDVEIRGETPQQS